MLEIFACPSCVPLANSSFFAFWIVRPTKKSIFCSGRFSIVFNSMLVAKDNCLRLEKIARYRAAFFDIEFHCPLLGGLLSVHLFLLSLESFVSQSDQEAPRLGEQCCGQHLEIVGCYMEHFPNFWLTISTRVTAHRPSLKHHATHETQRKLFFTRQNFFHHFGNLFHRAHNHAQVLFTKPASDWIWKPTDSRHIFCWFHGTTSASIPEPFFTKKCGRCQWAAAAFWFADVWWKTNLQQWCLPVFVHGCFGLFVVREIICDWMPHTDCACREKV